MAEMKQSKGGQAINDIIVSLSSIYISVATAFVFALLFLYLMSAYAKTIAWICIVLTAAGAFGGSVACWFMRASVIAQRGTAGTDTALYGDNQDDNETEAFWLLVGCIGLAALGCCFTCCVICGHKHVAQAIDVIDASADFTVENKRVIGVPVVYFIITLISFFVWLYSLACVVALNKVTADNSLIP